jgi:DNA mismatch endonuclease (patch repair protein)
MDTFSPEKRTQIMKSIKSNDTLPEMRVRSFLHRNGLRYRLHSKQLPGHPDIVLKKYNTVIFVHGCFWHHHRSIKCKRASLPKSNQNYWLPKLNKTIVRDKRHAKQLKDLGWAVKVIWECQVNDKQLVKLLRIIKKNL